MKYNTIRIKIEINNKIQIKWQQKLNEMKNKGKIKMTMKIKPDRQIKYK